MSIDAVRSVLARSKARGSARMVLLALAERANADGQMWPAVATVAAETNLSERMVQYHLRDLCEIGELSLDDRGNGGRGRAAVYRIVLPPDDPKGCNGLHPLKDEAGCTVSPERVQPIAERVQPVVEKGAMGCTRTVREPSENHQNLSEANASSPAGAGTAAKVEKDPALLVKLTELFHRHCPTLPKIKKVEGTRLKHVRARWRGAGENPLAWFEELFRMAGASERISTGTWCSFDWLMSPANSQKVLEGNYSNDRLRAPPPPPGTRYSLNASAPDSTPIKPSSELRVVPF